MTELFPIRTAAALTNIRPVTLRAWERRYGLVTPVRTESGRRMYTREHIEALHEIRALLDKGVSIGQVSRSLRARGKGDAGARDTWALLRKRMLSAVSRFSEGDLEEAYDEALASHSLEQVTRRLLTPLLAQLGDRWERAEGSVAEEHFFSMYLRNKLGARFHHRQRLTEGPLLLGACAPGEQHEIGLLLFGLAAHEARLRSVLLGANTPLPDLPLACRRAGCDAVVLSSSIEPSSAFLRRELPTLVNETGKPVFVGGDTSVRRRDEITAAGAIALGTDIANGVQQIAAQLTTRRKVRR